MSAAEIAADIVIKAIQAALAAKSTKQELMDAITAAMVEASDAEMHRELDGDAS